MTVGQTKRMTRRRKRRKRIRTLAISNNWRRRSRRNPFKKRS